LPNSARHAPDTSPTYPVPITVIVTIPTPPQSCCHKAAALFQLWRNTRKGGPATTDNTSVAAPPGAPTIWPPLRSTKTPTPGRPGPGAAGPRSRIQKPRPFCSATPQAPQPSRRPTAFAPPRGAPFRLYTPVLQAANIRLAAHKTVDVVCRGRHQQHSCHADLAERNPGGPKARNAYKPVGTVEKSATRQTTTIHGCSQRTIYAICGVPRGRKTLFRQPRYQHTSGLYCFIDLFYIIAIPFIYI
jgi:hypothetical protein